MYSEWLMPIPEKKYVRVAYFGKLQLLPKPILSLDDEKLEETPTLEEMLMDIWQQASQFNRKNFISGHLACSKSLHCVQLLEGRQETVMALMERIRRDPRVVILKEFKKELLSMNHGWGISMCYSFDITSAQLRMVQSDNVTLESMFDMIKNTYEVRKENVKLQAFYKNINETMLLKFMSECENEKKMSTGAESRPISVISTSAKDHDDDLIPSAPRPNTKSGKISPVGQTKGKVLRL